MPRGQRNTATSRDVHPPFNMSASPTCTNSKTSKSDRTASYTARGVTRSVDPRLLDICIKYERILTAQEENHARELHGGCGDCHTCSSVPNRPHRHHGRPCTKSSHSDMIRTNWKHVEHGDPSSRACLSKGIHSAQARLSMSE